MTDQRMLAAIRKRYNKRQEPGFVTCSACGHRQEAPTLGLPMASGMAAEAGRCQKCHNGVMQFTFAINTVTFQTPDQDMAELFALLTAQSAHVAQLQQQRQRLANDLRDVILSDHRTAADFVEAIEEVLRENTPENATSSPSGDPT